MKKNNLLVLSILVLFSVVSCKNFMEGDSFLTNLEQSVEYQKAPFAGILLTCDSKACKNMIPEAGKIEDKKAGDSFELQFEEKEEYYFEKWVAEPSDSVEFENAESRKTKATIVNTDSQITIKPVCHTRKVLTVNFSGENGSTYPFETKKYLSGEVFDISFSESAGFAFVNWSYSVKSGEKNPATIGSSGNVQTSVTVGELTKDSEITITAHSAKRPGVINYAPGQNEKGEPLNSIITVYFDNEMDESSIYFSNQELTELGITDSEGNLTGDYIKLTDSECENKCYGYQIKGDDNSIVYKNITIYNNEDSTQNYLKYYKSPRLDDTHKKLEIPTNYENLRLPVTKNILVTISSQMGTKVDNKLVHMEKDKIWYYFTENEEDVTAPAVELSATALLNSNLSQLPTDANQIVTNFNDFDYQKSINLSENGKILFSGTMKDLQSGVAYLAWTLNKLNLKNNELERTAAANGYITNFNFTESTASFNSDNNTNSGEIDLSSILTPTKEAVGMYEVSANVFDNCGNKSEKLNYYFYYDKYVSPVINLTETRVSDDKSTLKWKNPKDEEFEKIEIYYDNEMYIPTEEEKDKLLSQNQLLGISVNIPNLIPDHKYEYKVILFDKFGNSSLSVYVDNEPLKEKSQISDYEIISKNEIQLKFYIPDLYAYKYSVIKFSEPEKYIIEGASNNIIQDATGDIKYDDHLRKYKIITLKVKNNENIRFNTSFTIEDYDYSGNKTETVYQKKAEPKEGFYYYKDKFWSKSKIEVRDSDLLGVICYTGGNTLLGNEVKIIALSNFTTSENTTNFFYTANMTLITKNINTYKTISLKLGTDGRTNYDIMRKLYPELMKKENENSTYPNQLIWPYLNELNNNIDLDNQKYFVWYVPSYAEMEYVLKSRKSSYGIPSSFASLKSTDSKSETFITSSFGRNVSSSNITIAMFAIQIETSKDGKSTIGVTKSDISTMDKSHYAERKPYCRLMAQVPLE